MSIAKKFGLILFLPILVATGIFWEFIDFQTMIEAEVPFTNAAGRQRMLSEQLHNYAYMVHIGQQEDRRAMKALIAQFADSIDVLQYGGHMPDINTSQIPSETLPFMPVPVHLVITGISLPPAPAEILPSLVRVRRLWSPLKETLLRIADLPETNPQSWLAWETANASLPVLTVASHKVVTAFEAYDMRLRRKMETLLGIGIIFTLLFFISGYWATRRYIVRPVLQLTGMAAALDAGDYACRVAVNTHDELAKLANTFNSMAENITTAIRLRLRQKELTKAIITLGSQPVKENVIKHVGEAAKNITDARYVMIAYSVDGEKRFHASGLTPEQERALAGLLGMLWEDKQTVRIDDITAHPGRSGFPPGYPSMKSFLGVPILFGKEMFGAIYLMNKENGQPFTKEDENSVGMLASACAVAVSNTKNFKELKTVNAQLEQRVAERTNDLERANRRLRNHEVELELINDELASASEAKNQFLANTSHELRTPLNSIIGFSGLLGNPRVGPLVEKQQHYVNHIRTSANRLLGIINNLLDISKMEAGMMDVEETACVPLHLAQQVIGELKPLADVKRISLTLHEGDGADTDVMVDAGKLHQILVNLVGNALKFTPEGGRVDVEIRVEAQTTGAYRIIINVRDTGIGIAKEDQECIFEPFIQARGGLDRKYGGTGLGLALTRKQVNMLGGKLTLVSSSGSGSMFTVELPTEPARTAKQAEKLSPELLKNVIALETTETLPTEGLRPRILIADDDAERSAAAIRMMEQEGYHAEHSDMAHAVQNVRQACPFLIMLGIPARKEQLHRYLQLFKHNEASRNVPLILLGGRADSLEFSMGTLDIVGKGVTQHELLDVLARHSICTPTRLAIPTILVIDDDLSTREFLKETLVAEGYRVLLSAGGEEGICLAIEREPDLIILDLMMPEITGFDVVNRLRQHPAASDIPIIIYTAKELTREESLHLGHEVERVLLKGSVGKSEIMRQLRKLELMYPVYAHLIDTKLGCFNLRYLLRRLDQETATAKRHGESFSLIGWEMNEYDDYVRKHGERWGVTALKELLEMVKDVTRRGDICIRIDVSRFVILLPNTMPKGAVRVADKLHIRIRRQHFPLPDKEFGTFTPSFGIVHFDEDAEDAVPLLQILQDRITKNRQANDDQGMVRKI